MSATSTALGHLLTVRSLEPGDLPGLILIEKQRLGNRQIGHDSPIRLPSNDGGIWVAAVQGVVVGYLVYQLLPESVTASREVVVGAGRGVRARRAAPIQTLRVSLHHLYVAPEWRRQGIGRALVDRFDPEHPKCESYWIQAAVPESNLPVQLLLRSIGYRAIRVLRGYYGDEAAYLMERERN